jgi:hypothetical protein
MKRQRRNIGVIAAFAALLLAATPHIQSAMAQQITGVAGSPSATPTIDGKQLLPPPPDFGGVIKETYKDSTPWWPPAIRYHTQDSDNEGQGADL